MNWDVLTSGVNSRGYWRELHSTNSLKTFCSKSDEHPGVDSSFNDISLERNFENQFQIGRSVMAPWP